jgi:hypothetical protein
VGDDDDRKAGFHGKSITAGRRPRKVPSAPCGERKGKQALSGSVGCRRATAPSTRSAVRSVHCNGNGRSGGQLLRPWTWQGRQGRERRSPPGWSGAPWARTPRDGCACEPKDGPPRGTRAPPPLRQPRIVPHEQVAVAQQRYGLSRPPSPARTSPRLAGGVAIRVRMLSIKTLLAG